MTSDESVELWGFRLHITPYTTVPPTAEPTASPTPEPSNEPTLEPTPIPTKSPTLYPKTPKIRNRNIIYNSLN